MPSIASKKIRTIAAAIALATVLGPAHHVHATTEGANEAANTLGKLLAEKGIKIFGIKTGYLKRGESTTFNATLRGAKNFVFVVGGCVDAHDLDIRVTNDADDATLAADEDDQAVAVAEFETSGNVDATISIKMHDSTPDGAHYALLAGEMENLEQDAAPVAPDITLDLDTVIQGPDGKLTLREMIGGHKAIYLRFWATWCGPCIALVPTIDYRMKKLGDANIATVAINNELQGTGGDYDKAVAKMTRMRFAHPIYAETQEGVLAKALTIDSVPRSVVVARDGKVLFNGHPLDENLEVVLESLGVDSTFNLKGGLEGEEDEPARAASPSGDDPAPAAAVAPEGILAGAMTGSYTYGAGGGADKGTTVAFRMEVAPDPGKTTFRGTISEDYSGFGTARDGKLRASVIGAVQELDGETTVTFKKKYLDFEQPEVRYIGVWNTETNVIKGSWSFPDGDGTGPFQINLLGR